MDDDIKIKDIFTDDEVRILARMAKGQASEIANDMKDGVVEPENCDVVGNILQAILPSDKEAYYPDGCFLNDNGKVDIGRVVDHLMEQYTFKTMADTEEVYIWWDGVYKSNGEVFIKGKVEEMLNNESTEHIKSEVIGHIRGLTYTPRSWFNRQDLPFLPLKNGILNLDTNEFSGLTPTLLVTYQIPVDFIDGVDCPNVKNFLNEVFAGYEDVIPLIQEIFGYCLYPGMPAQKSFWWYGSGANGKTSVATLLMDMLGKDDNVVSIDLCTLENQRFAPAGLYGKMLNSVGEPNPERLGKSTLFKQATGGDPIYSDRKNRSPIIFNNFAKFLIYANDYPEIADSTHAFWRRIIVVKFPNRFEGDNDVKDISKTIETPKELSGLLNWSLEGLKRVKNNNWEFSVTKTMEESKVEFMLLSNPVEAFIKIACTLDKNGRTSIKDLYESFKDFCEENEAKICTKTMFSKKLGECYGIAPDRWGTKGKIVRGFSGISLKNLDAFDAFDAFSQAASREKIS